MKEDTYPTRLARYVYCRIRYISHFNLLAQITIEGLVLSNMVQTEDETPPIQDFVWDSGWSVDYGCASIDADGWSYGLSWWMLSLRLREGIASHEPRMSLVRRRKWVRHLRACAGGNLPAAIIDGTPPPQNGCVTSTHAPETTGTALPVCGMQTATMAMCSASSNEESSPESAMHLEVIQNAHRVLARAPSVSPPELPPEARDVLVTHALQAIKLAEEMMQDADPLYMRRWFHAAVVYFEVLCSFGDLGPELDSQRQRVRRLARLCSHLHENCVVEHDAASRHITDIYNLHSDQVLGHGSYGTVCLATHRETNDEYACKVLSINRVGPQYVDKLHSEISSMRQLDHPNIVRLREVFFGCRKIYLVMDICTGGELFDLVNMSSEYRTEHCATRFMTEMFSAVQYLHEHGVVHRDLKLENWLFEHHTGSHLKLIDFGLAKHFLVHERIHGAVGSMYYVAPEVLRGSYDSRCDLWSLGVIAYMLVSGAPPFWGRDDRDIRRSIIAGRWEFPQRFFSQVSPMAKDFIARLLTSDPELRMSAAAALTHPWLKAANTPYSSSPLPRWQRIELLGTLKEFVATSLLQKVVLAVVAFNMTPRQVTAVRNLFESIDLDHSGTISYEELASAVRSAPISGGPKGHDQNTADASSTCDECKSVDDTTMIEIFKAIDISRTTEINFTEFLAATMWRRIHLDEQHMRRVFQTLDINGSGKLDAASIKALVGIDYDDDEVNQLIADADEDGDGCLCFSDFVKSWRANAPISTQQTYPHHVGMNGVASVVHAIAHGTAQFLGPPVGMPSKAKCALQDGTEVPAHPVQPAELSG